MLPLSMFDHLSCNLQISFVKYSYIEWKHLQLESLTPMYVRARLHGASTSTLRSICDDTSDSVLIENKSCSRMGLQPIFE